MNSESNAARSNTRLVSELDSVIEDHYERAEGQVSNLKVLASELLDTWRTLSASLELRRKFAEGTPHPDAQRFSELDLPRDLFRWLHDTRNARHQGARSARARQPAGRVDEILQVLSAAGRPLSTDEIVDGMADKNLLEGVNDPRATVSAALSRGFRLGLVERVSRGVYQASDDLRGDGESG